ncbi:hypothetical protein INT44_001590 [Umbelopsis vinacea]|uniref:Uncharacterized protein n=1 Tax=Umbelopsis vinacea TaxID=44442 RepID=A0A8H7PR97_9FUNG|nr:hypothetical protein INT44_001590 [Umbelopsis vinacea]
MMAGTPSPVFFPSYVITASISVPSSAEGIFTLVVIWRAARFGSTGQVPTGFEFSQGLNWQLPFGEVTSHRDG